MGGLKLDKYAYQIAADFTVGLQSNPARKCGIIQYTNPSKISSTSCKSEWIYFISCI